jgi:chlorite dismutase
MPAPLPIAFVAGATGPWRIDRIAAFRGAALPPAERLAVQEGGGADPVAPAAWRLRGVTSNLRYTTSAERQSLAAAQPALGRPPATCAALLPIRKTDAWWELAQDTRRRVLEEVSRHVAIGLEYLPAIARRLVHSRDLGEPFDFLTWFEFAPADAAAFDSLLARLRATEEWTHVERDIDIRLSREA